MRIGVTGPDKKPSKGACRRADEKRANGKFRAEAAGEFVLEPHGRLERITATVVRDVVSINGGETNVRQIEKHAETKVVGFAQRRGERALQHRGGRGEVRRQTDVKRAGEVLPALHDGERIQSVGRDAAERRGVEFSPCKGEIVGEAIDGLAVEQGFERAALLDGARRDGQPEFSGKFSAVGGGKTGAARWFHGVESSKAD